MNKYDPQIHHRRSIRLKGYDYSQAGLYYITICCQDRACLFGDITNRKMILNDAGKMVETQWLDLTTRFPNIRLHEYIVMPNHFHAILEITNDIDTPSGQPQGIAPTAPDDIPVRATLVVARTDETESEIERSEDPEPPSGQPQGIAPTAHDDIAVRATLVVARTDETESEIEKSEDPEPPSGQPQGIAPTAPDDISVRATLVVARTDEPESEIEKSEDPEPPSGQPQGIAPTAHDDIAVRATLVVARTDETESEIEIEPDDPESPLGRSLVVAPTGAGFTRNKTVGDIIGAFKSIVTVEYIRGVRSMDWPAFRKRLLQRDYYEHIIRNEGEYQRISDYIVDNPAKWQVDKFHGK